MLQQGFQPVMVFPGQGAQRPGMGDSLHEQKTYREHLALADEILGFGLSELMTAGPAETLTRTDIAQPALLTLETGLYTLWREQGGAQPAAVAGHSLGEYSALVVAGVLNFSDALRLIQLRAQLMQTACEQAQGGMAAVLRPTLTSEELIALCQQLSQQQDYPVVLANDNSPQQLVISGELQALDAVCEVIKSQKLGRPVKLKVAGAFHSPLMQSAQAELAAAIEKLELQEPQIPVVMNVSGNVPASVSELRALLTQQIISPVRWRESVRCLEQFGKLFLELGPSTLTPLIRQCLSDNQPEIEAQNLLEWNELETAVKALR